MKVQRVPTCTRRSAAPCVTHAVVGRPLRSLLVKESAFHFGLTIRLHFPNASERAGAHMLRNTNAVVNAARAAGVTVMHAPIASAPGYGELTRHPYGILKGVVHGNCFVKGTWGAAITLKDCTASAFV